MICKECAWEADTRKFHGNSVRIPKGRGHAACEGCDCHHQPVAEPLPGVEEYAEDLSPFWGRE